MQVGMKKCMRNAPREMQRNAKVNNNNKYFQSYSKVLLCFPSKVRHKIPELANLYDLHLVKLYLR